MLLNIIEPKISVDSVFFLLKELSKEKLAYDWFKAKAELCKFSNSALDGLTLLIKFNLKSLGNCIILDHFILKNLIKALININSDEILSKSL